MTNEEQHIALEKVTNQDVIQRAMEIGLFATFDGLVGLFIFSRRDRKSDHISGPMSRVIAWDWLKAHALGQAHNDADFTVEEKGELLSTEEMMEISNDGLRNQKRDLEDALRLCRNERDVLFMCLRDVLGMTKEGTN